MSSDPAMSSASENSAALQNVPLPDIPNPAFYKDFDLVKSIVAPFRQIYGMILEDEPFKIVNRIVKDDPTSGLKSDSNVPIYTIHFTNDTDEDAWKTGRAAFPPGVSPEMQMALLKFSTCDFVTFTFLPHIAKALENIGARVEWWYVRMKPRYLIHFEPDEFTEPDHAMIAITTASDEKYVADLSIEQFGYSGQEWFNTSAAFVDNHTSTGIWTVPQKEELAAFEPSLRQNAFCKSLYHRATKICGELDWTHYFTLPADEREAWIEAKTGVILARINSESA